MYWIGRCKWLPVCSLTNQSKPAFQQNESNKKTIRELTYACFPALGVGCMFIGLQAFVLIGQI